MFQDVMTKEDNIAIINSQIVASVGYLSHLLENVERLGAIDSFPVFKDATVQSLIAKYRELQSVRGW